MVIKIESQTPDNYMTYKRWYSGVHAVIEVFMPNGDKTGCRIDYKNTGLWIAGLSGESIYLNENIQLYSDTDGTITIQFRLIINNGYQYHKLIISRDDASIIKNDIEDMLKDKTRIAIQKWSDDTQRKYYTERGIDPDEYI